MIEIIWAKSAERPTFQQFESANLCHNSSWNWMKPKALKPKVYASQQGTTAAEFVHVLLLAALAYSTPTD